MQLNLKELEIGNGSQGLALERDEKKGGKKSLFFGYQSTSLEHLTKHFSHIQFHSMNQTHSSQIFRAGEQHLNECDGLFTDKKNEALVIRTADCMPVFLFSPRWIIALHIGWRGLPQQILLRSLKEIESQENVGGLVSRDEFSVVVGPHIGFQSFEVDKDVAEMILLSTLPKQEIDSQKEQPIFTDPWSDEKLVAPSKNSNKYLIHLFECLKQQCLFAGIKEENIFSLNMDTFSDERFPSYRRLKERAGRSYSFIVQSDGNEYSDK